MALNKTLNATCDLDGYLFCRMPADTLEVDIRVKTKWESTVCFRDTYTHTEKYRAWDRADRRSSVQTRKRRTLHREVRSSHEDNNTTSETDVLVGQGFRYPSQVFTDSEFSATVPQMLEKIPSPKNNRKPLAGWVEHGHRTVQAAKENRQNIDIENARSVSQEEFNNSNNDI